jgi:ABC-type oligopeptide transport system substrate-binding subunit
MIIMKKLTVIFLCFAMALSLAACGNSSSNETSAPETSDSAASSETQEPSAAPESAESTEEPSSQPETEGEEGGTLIAYFTMPEDVNDN